MSGTGTWEGQFRALLAARGYTDPSIDYDPLYGWTVLVEFGGHEFESRTPAGVRALIEALPPKPPTDNERRDLKLTVDETGALRDGHHRLMAHRAQKWSR